MGIELRENKVWRPIKLKRIKGINTAQLFYSSAHEFRKTVFNKTESGEMDGLTGNALYTLMIDVEHANSEIEETWGDENQEYDILMINLNASFIYSQMLAERGRELKKEEDEIRESGCSFDENEFSATRSALFYLNNRINELTGRHHIPPEMEVKQELLKEKEMEEYFYVN